MKKKISKMERQRREEQSKRDMAYADRKFTNAPTPLLPSPDLAEITSKVDEARFALLPPEEQAIVRKLFVYRFALLPNFDVQRVASEAMYVSPAFFSEHGITDMDEKRLIYAVATSGLFHEYDNAPHEFDDSADENQFVCSPIHMLGLYWEAGGYEEVDRVIELCEGLERKIPTFEFWCLYIKVDDTFAPYEFRFSYLGRKRQESLRHS